MLQFFRKYQKFFFLGITVVIVISFSFFGTLNSMPERAAVADKVAFTAVDGEQVMRSQLDAMVRFIATDREDQRLMGGVWGPNFLNDGVIAKDFLETGVAKVLLRAYEGELAEEWAAKRQREQRYSFYTHPGAPFLDVKGVWNYFAPDLKWNVERLQHSSNLLAEGALQARINAYLGERKFSSQQLRQILMYQQRQYGWLTPDETLPMRDLSLFGYHTVEDWFGKDFLRLAAQFVMNGAKEATQKGYVVSKEEALTDLHHNAEKAHGKKARGYLHEQIRRMGLSQSDAVRIWQQVLLFRRLLEDRQSSVLVDRLTCGALDGYAKEGVKGTLFRLPEPFRFSQFRQLQKWEVYRDAIARRGVNIRELLALPKAFYVLSDVQARSPELVRKPYQLRVAEVSTQELEIRVPLKEMWNWELAHFAELCKSYPDLAQAISKTKEEQFAALEGLDAKTREVIDGKARRAVVSLHPEWLEEALESAEERALELAATSKGGNFPIKGLKERKSFLSLLDSAPLRDSEGIWTEKEQESSSALSCFSADQNHFYRIQVVGRGDWEVMTFAEADGLGVLDELVDDKLESFYQASKEKYRKEGGEIASFAEVRVDVAKEVFAPVLDAVKVEYKKLTNASRAEDKYTPDFLASVRFYSFVAGAQVGKTSFSEEALATQWQLEEVPYAVDRATGHELIDLQEALALPVGERSSVCAKGNGELFFYSVDERTGDLQEESSVENLFAAQEVLSKEAMSLFFDRLVSTWKQSQAMVLEEM